MKKRLGFLHTAKTHVDGFDNLLARRSEQIEAIHLVREDLLATAMQDGKLTAELKKEIEIVLKELAAKSDLVLCTCSSISEAAEELAKSNSIAFVRIDRPMAERAIKAKRIAVLAALDSTLAVTEQLIRQVAKQNNSEPEIKIHLCSNAWQYFERGEQDSYHKTIAGCIDKLAQNSDLIVLAQASMAGARAFCKTDKPVLASPEPALDYCIEKLKP